MFLPHLYNGKCIHTEMNLIICFPFTILDTLSIAFLSVFISLALDCGYYYLLQVEWTTVWILIGCLNWFQNKICQCCAL